MNPKDLNELETRLLNVAYQLHETNNDIEAYLQPDDSASWGDNASDLLRIRDELESEFNQLVSGIKAQAIEEFLQHWSMGSVPRSTLQRYADNLRNATQNPPAGKD